MYFIRFHRFQGSELGNLCQPVATLWRELAPRSSPYRNLCSILAAWLSRWLLAGLADCWLRWLGWLGWLAVGWLLAGLVGLAGCWLGWLGWLLAECKDEDWKESDTLEFRGARPILIFLGC